MKYDADTIVSSRLISILVVYNRYAHSKTHPFNLMTRSSVLSVSIPWD
jgi:hypothetical protein